MRWLGGWVVFAMLDFAERAGDPDGWVAGDGLRDARPGRHHHQVVDQPEIALDEPLGSGAARAA